LKKIILFSQSPADTKYVLSIYERYKTKRIITIFVVNVYNNFVFYQKLGLTANLKFIPLIAQDNKFKFLAYIVRLRFLRRRLCLEISDSSVYYFSNNHDYVTSTLIEGLSKANSVYFVDINKIDGDEIKSKKNYLKKMVVKVLLGVNIKFFNSCGFVGYQYIHDKTKVNVIDMSVDMNTLSNHMEKIQTADGRKSLLLFETNNKSLKYFTDYEKDLVGLLSVIVNTYKIYVKPHPRLGYSKCLDFYDVDVIDVCTPSEFLSLDAFSVLLGVDTSAIATATHHKKFSLIDFFGFKNQADKEDIKIYLNKLSKGKLEYLDDISQLG